MQERSDPNVVREMRIKLPLPLVIPVAALVLIAALTIGLSRILLNVPSEAAVIIALAVALDILGSAAYLAARPRPSPGTLAELMMVALFPVVIGIVLTQINFSSAESKRGGARPPAAVTSTATLVANNVAFEEKTVTVVGTKGFTIHFDNKDSTTHNFAIYDKQGGKELFKGDVITGPNTTDYQVKPLKAGTYYFQCDIHPTSMNGSLTVK
jgi:plastocyanin